MSSEHTSENQRLGGTRQPRYDIADEQIDLSFSYYFNWGYPDYMREALQVLISMRPATDPIDPHKKLPYRELRKYIEEADSYQIRYLVAGNPNTPQSVLDFLGKTDNSSLCERVAENPRAHFSTLARLSKHSSAAVRMAVAENSNTPLQVLLQLANDTNVDIRYSMAENINLPEPVLQALAADENPYVSARASRTLISTKPAEVVTPDFSRVARRRIGQQASS